MTRRPSTLDQHLGIGGSDIQSDAIDQTLEPLELGQAISGQAGSSASIVSFVAGTVTISGLTGIIADSVGRFITVSEADTAANNGTFQIKSAPSASSVTYVNTSAVAPDANNGSIVWVERSPYTLEDDINHSRTDRRLIKGTLDWHSDIPTYRRPTATAVDVDTNLDNIADNTLDAHAWIESRHDTGVAVSVSDAFVTITDIGNLKHADFSDVTGVPVTDGYDAGNDLAAFVEITDAEIDGYGDGGSLLVLAGPNEGERVIGLTRAGSSTSPDSVEIEFFSVATDDWDLASLTAYSWEDGQPSIINVCYGYRERLDRFTETATRATLIKGALSGGARGATGATGDPGNSITTIFAENPVSGDEDPSFFTTEQIILEEMRAIIRGGATPSITWTIRFDSSRAAVGTEVVVGGTVSTNITTGDVVTVFTNGTIPANSFVWLEMPTVSTGADAPDAFAVTLTGGAS